MLVAYLKTTVIVLIAVVLIIGVIVPALRLAFAQNEINNDLGNTIRDNVNSLGKDLSNSIIGMVKKQMKASCEDGFSGSSQTVFSEGSGSSQSVMSSQSDGTGKSIISSEGSRQWQALRWLW